jgi:hypothetical protein
MVGAMPRLASFVMNAVGSDFKIQVGLACLPYHSFCIPRQHVF